MKRLRGDGLRRLVQSFFGGLHPLGLPLLGDRAQDRACDLRGVYVHHIADEGRAGGVSLSKNARAAAVGEAIGGSAQLMLDHVAAFLDHEHGFEPIGEGARAFLFQGPYKADFINANPERHREPVVKAEIAKRLPDVEIALAGGGDAETRTGAVERNAVEAVCAGKSHRGRKPEVTEHVLLLRRRKMEARIAATGRVDTPFRGD